MARHNDFNPYLNNMWDALKAMQITAACNPKDPMRARQQLIEQYNRKPSVYVEQNIGRDCLHVIGGASSCMLGLMQQAQRSMAAEKSTTSSSTTTNPQHQHHHHHHHNNHQHHEPTKLAAGVPSCAFCDSIDGSIFKTLQRTICYAGAGLGLVGVGVITLFGLCTAAGTACTVTMCNKFADNHCHIEPYDPVGTEVYYEGRPVVMVQNSYAPIQAHGIAPAYAYISAPHQPHYV